MSLAQPPRLKAFVAFAILFVLYQSAEGLGGRVFDNFGIQAVLMVAALLAGWPVARWLGWRGYEAYGLDLRWTWSHATDHVWETLDRHTWKGLDCRRLRIVNTSGRALELSPASGLSVSAAY